MSYNRNSGGGVLGSLSSMPQNRRTVRLALLSLLAVMLCVNILITVLSGRGSDTVQPQGSGGQSSVTDDDTAGGDPSSPDVQKGDTAFWNITPSDGAYSALIDRFIQYERSVMQNDEVVMSFTGDCTLGTWPTSTAGINYNDVYKNSGSPTYSFDMVKSFFLNDDYTYINLETTLTTSTSIADGQYYNFKGDPSWAKDMIAASGVDGCNLANNHSYDWGKKGYDETVQVVKAAGMDLGDEGSVVVTKCGDVEVVIISCSYIWPCGGRDKLFGDELTSSIVSQVQQYKRPDNIVIVCGHWGLERKSQPEEQQYTSARRFINAGADMVIGHHPHTLQGIEEYNGKYIFYSLGNFAFGGKATTDEVNRISVLLRPRFALRDGTAAVTGISLVPCYTTSDQNKENNNYQPIPLCGSTAQNLLDNVLSCSTPLEYGVQSLGYFNTPTAEWEY